MQERQRPIDMNQARMDRLVAQRLSLRQRLAEVDTEIGKLDLIMLGHAPIRPQQQQDFFWQRRVNYDQTRAEQAAQQSDAKEMARPPYENLVQ